MKEREIIKVQTPREVAQEQAEHAQMVRDELGRRRMHFAIHIRDCQWEGNRLDNAAIAALSKLKV